MNVLLHLFRYTLCVMLVVGLGLSSEALGAKKAKGKRAKKGKRGQPTEVVQTPAAPATPATPATPQPAPAAPAAPAPPAAKEQDPKAQAALAFEAGQKHYQAGLYVIAIEDFSNGYKAVNDPIFLFNLAQAHRLAGHNEDALRFYKQYLQESPSAANKEAVEARIAALSPLVENKEPVAQQDPKDEARAKALALVREGRALAKEKKVAQGADKLKEAVEIAKKAELDREEMANFHYAYGSMLLRARKEEAAIAELTKAASLSEKDPDIQLEMANAYSRLEDHDKTIEKANRALDLGGLDAEDQADAKELIRDAKSQKLHDRLTLDGSVTVAYDSNVLQGTQETIGDKFTGGRSGTTTTMPMMRPSITTLLQDIRKQYLEPAAPRQEHDVPISIFLDLNGRPVGNSKYSFWMGYRFSQVFMTLTSFDHDVYNFQEHVVSLKMRTSPSKYLSLNLRAEGFVNFSGLVEFAPFQAGATGGLDLTLKATSMWHTRLTYTHQYRAALDRTQSSYTNECNQTIRDSNTYTDGNRDDLGLSQELRAKWLRARLGYQFHSDLTGTLLLDMPYSLTVAGVDSVIGCYNYQAPLSYFGHEGLLTARFLLPLEFEIYAAARYEYRAYRQPYRASFKSIRAMIADVVLDAEDRRDHRIAADLTVGKALPKGFGLELSYSYVANLSSIKNGIDNRNYQKHVVALWTSYSF